MIFNSRAIVASCAGDALLTSIVNFFIFLSYFLIVFVSGRLELEERVRLRLRHQPRIPQAPDKFLALAHISGTEVPLIVNEIVH